MKYKRSILTKCPLKRKRKERDSLIVKKDTKGNLFSERVKVLRAEVKEGKSGPFVSATVLRINKKEIGVRKFGVSELGNLTPGGFIHLEGTITDFRGELQVIAKEETPFTPDNPDDFNNLPYVLSELDSEFHRLFQSIESPILADLIKWILSQPELKRYKKAEAASKIHHAFEGGLYYHSVTMARAADALCGVYPYLNRDLLVSAALLHDAGKTIEIKDGAYTKEGILLGHIVILNNYIQKYLVVKEGTYSSEEADLVAHLNHIILSHHGRLEWGSPVLGATPEAILFHFIDKIDADLMISTTTIGKYESGDLTERVWSMDNRRLISL